MIPKSPLTTHVLDLTSGKPAAGMSVVLERFEESRTWRQIATARTDTDGRIAGWLPPGALPRGTYRLVFATGEYFAGQSRPSFYPQVIVEFELAGGQCCHLPLLVSPFGYSTYRGS